MGYGNTAPAAQLDSAGEPAGPAANPALSFSTYFGGKGLDVATGVAVDAAGYVYVAGYTNSTDIPSSAPGLRLRGGGSCGDGLDTYPCFDVFVAKFEPSGGRLVYFAQFGGSGDDVATDISLDGFGNAYVTGYTNSADFPTYNAAQASHGGGTCGSSLNPIPCYDVFVARLNATGTALTYATYLGGTDDDFGEGIAVDPAGYAAVTGITASADFPTRRAWQSIHGQGTYDAFVAKLAPAGSLLVYSTFLGGSGEDIGSKVALDSAGAAYLTGSTNSEDFPVAGAFQPSIGGGTCGAAPNTSPCFDAFVTKLSGDGAMLVYSTYLGGSGGDSGYGIAVSSASRAYVTGLTVSRDFPVTPGALAITGGGTTVDAFVTSLNSSGASAVYSTYLGGAGAEAGWDIAVDSLGNAYSTGYTNANGFPVASPVQAASGGYYDAFLAKLNAAGSALMFSTYLGGTGNEKARGIALDSAGNAYLAGDTFSSDFPTTAGAYQPSFGSGAFDGFIAKLTGLALPVVTLSETSVDFSSQAVGTTSEARAITLGNAGDAMLELAGIAASGDFAQTSDCGGSVAPGIHCTIEVTFSPRDWGPRFGALTVTSNTYGSPHAVNLIGKGVAAPGVSLSTASLTFSSQTVGTTSAAQNVTLISTGQAVLNITSLDVNGDFAASHNCGFELAVGGSCTIAVTFTPKSSRTKVGNVTLTDNAPGSPHVITLSGVGSATAVPLPPGE